MKSIRTISFYIGCLSLFLVQSAFSASYIFDVTEDQYAKEIKVVISVDPEGSSLNAYEGQISFDKLSLSLGRIETDNSIVGAWSIFPEAGNSPLGDDTIYFEGISKSPFSGVIAPGSQVPASGKLLTLIFLAKKEGETEVRLTGTSMYLSDGDATEVPVRDIVIPLTLKKSFLKSNYFVPNIPEKTSEVNTSDSVYGTVTSSIDVYDGKKFAVFENRNKQKSLVSFQIAETGTKDPTSVPSFSWVTAKSPHLLTKTSNAAYVHIKALYSDGSYAYKTLEAVENSTSNAAVSYILGVLLFLALVIYYASPFKKKYD